MSLTPSRVRVLVADLADTEFTDLLEEAWRLRAG